MTSADDDSALASHVSYHPEVAQALASRQPVVALESTVIAHGLPWPQNLELARRLEEIVRQGGAIPATIGIIAGKIRVGLTDAELEHLATASNVRKVSRRDLALAIARREDGATTVAGTMIAAHLAGIQVFATGGIGGVHSGLPFDVSADLNELARTPVVVVCAGAKAILDLPLTLEWLETHGVPVVGYGTDEFPAFYSRTSGLRVDARVNSPAEVVNIVQAQLTLRLGSGLLVTVPIPQEAEIPAEAMAGYIERAVAEAERAAIRGHALTPFLLRRVAELTGGESIRANLALLENNARVATEISLALAPTFQSEPGPVAAQ